MTRPGPKVDPHLGPLTPKTVLLDDLSIDMLQAVGGGNLSHGVRIAARVAYGAYQREPDVASAPIDATDKRGRPCRQ